jgi:hypothetical protein
MQPAAWGGGRLPALPDVKAEPYRPTCTGRNRIGHSSKQNSRLNIEPAVLKFRESNYSFP